MTIKLTQNNFGTLAWLQWEELLKEERERRRDGSK